MSSNTKLGLKDPMLRGFIAKAVIAIVAFILILSIDPILNKGVGVNNPRVVNSSPSITVLNSEELNPSPSYQHSKYKDVIAKTDSLNNADEVSYNSTELILNSAVIDNAQILTSEQKQILINRLENIYNDGLAQIAIVIVPSTHGENIFDYAMNIAEQWKLGSAEDDDGLLIVMAVEDRNMYIVTGYGLEGVLPDAVLKRYIDESFTPSFKDENYFEGLMLGMDRIENRLNTDVGIMTKALEVNAQRNKQINESSSGNFVLGLFFIALSAGAFLRLLFGLNRKVAAVFFTLVYIVGAYFGEFGYLSAFCYAIILFILLWMKWFKVSHDRGAGGSNNRRLFTGGVMGSGGGSSSGGYSGGGGSFGGGGAGGSW